jgi:hypothetical protein
LNSCLQNVSYEEALLPETQHLHGVPLPQDIEADHIINRISDWQNVDDERMKFIVDLSVKHNLANTPTLNAGRLLQNYRNFSSVVKPRGSVWGRLLPNFYRDVVWDPVEGLPLYRKLSRERLNKLQDAFEKKKKLVKMLYDAGAPVFLGTGSSSTFHYFPVERCVTI